MDETALAIKRNSEAPKLRLYCPNEECGLTGEVSRIGNLGGGVVRGVEHRKIRRWVARPRVEATDDRIVTMTIPRDQLACPDCGTRGYIA